MSKNENAKEIESALRELANAKTIPERKLIRARLRRMGHHGGLGTGRGRKANPSKRTKKASKKRAVKGEPATAAS